MTENQSDITDKIIEKLVSFSKDPLGFALFAFDWGEGELKDRQLEPWQVELLSAIRDNLMSIDEVLQYAIASGHGIGKAQPKSLIIDTPNGKKRWGDLKIGDFVFSLNGKPTKIIAIHEQGIKKIYRVNFDDRSSTFCCGDHVWTLSGRQQRRNKLDSFVDMTTEEIVKKGVRRSNGTTTTKQWHLPLYQPVIYKRKKVNIHPYVMGAWLGDGGRTRSVITTGDKEVVHKIIKCGYAVSLGKKQKTEAVSCYVVGIKAHLKKLGVIDKYSYQKSIPKIYLENSVEIRSEVLRGLLDSDGEVNKTGSIIFSSCSIDLSNDVVWLVRSLGGKARIQPTTKKPKYNGPNGEKLDGKDCYRVTITMPDNFKCFYVSRKQKRIHVNQKRYLTRWINSIEEHGNEDCRCITVESKDGLYLTNDFIVTHNSCMVSILILWAISTKPNTKGVVTANTDTQLRTKTWPELYKWHSLFIGKDLFTVTATAIFAKEKGLDKTWRIDCIPWSEHNTEAFAGLHNQGNRILLIMDEASAVHDRIWEVSEGALTDQNTERLWLTFGNPTRNVGRFAECFGRYRHRWNHKKIDSRTVSFTDKKQIEKWAQDYGEDSDFFRVRVRGEFPASSDRQFISTALVEAARGKAIAERSYMYAPIILGVDPAYSGSDECVIYMRQGPVAKQLAVYTKLEDDVAFAGYIAKFEDEYKADAVFVDMGYGTGVVSIGRSLGRNWQLIPFASQSSDNGYLNKRAEIWGLARKWLQEGGCLPDDSTICQELTAPEFYIKLDGKIQLEKKEDIKKRLGFSPNRADALCLTFSFPVIKKSYSPFPTKKQEYNPFT